MSAILAGASSLGGTVSGVLSTVENLGCAHDYGPGTMVYRGQRALDASLPTAIRLYNAQVVLYGRNHYSSITQQTAAHVWAGIQSADPAIAAQAQASGPVPNSVSTDPVPGGWIPANVGKPPCEGSGAASPYLTAWQQFIQTVQQNLGNTIAQAGASVGASVAQGVNPQGNYVGISTNTGTLVVVAVVLLVVVWAAFRR